MRIAQGATKPDLVLTLSDDSQPDGLVPLTDAESVRVIGRRNGVEVFDAPALNLSDDGTLTHLWMPEHTALPGVILLQVVVEWDDGEQVFDIDEVVEVIGVDEVPPLVTVTELINHMSEITLSAGQRSSAYVTLAGVQRGLERALHRRFQVAERTETVYPDPVTGFVMLSATPVHALLAVGGVEVLAAEQTSRVSPWGVNITGLGEGVAWWGGMPGGVVVRYRGGGGVDPDDLDDVRLAILEKASGIVQNRHDDARTPSDLDTRAPAPAPTPVHWTRDELDTWGMSRLRRKVAL